MAKQDIQGAFDEIMRQLVEIKAEALASRILCATAMNAMMAQADDKDAMLMLLEREASDRITNLQFGEGGDYDATVEVVERAQECVSEVIAFLADAHGLRRAE